MRKKEHKKPQKRKLGPKIIKVAAVVWVICIIAVFSILGFVVGVRHETFDVAPDVFAFSLLGLILLGVMAFAIGIITLIVMLISKSEKKKQNILTFLLKLFFALALLPVYLLLYIIKPVKNLKLIKHDGIRKYLKTFSIKPVLKNIVALLLIIGIILPIWSGGYALVGIMTIEALGYSTEPITISGTGSMYPTFPKGEGKDPKELAKQIVGTPGMMRYPNGLVIGGRRFFSYEVGRGDIVVIENDKIREMTQSMYGDPSGWVKRIVGMPGDKLELREGIVYLNGEPLSEPYTAQPRSTFGETFLNECNQITVPEGNIFVMGDNRKGSGDSREIGFVEISAINHVLPLKNQKGTLDQAWRDTSKDFDESSKIKLDKDRYLQLLNEKRVEAGVRELKYQSKLEASAESRGKKILEFDDFSFEATQSGYTMSQAMRDSNYYNTVWGEAPTQGYYEAEELIDNQFQFPESKKFLLEKTYQEVGISEVEGEINGCPTQVVVQHFAGYVPPNYSQTDIDSWKTSLSRLREIQPGWSELKNNNGFYEGNKADIDRINEIITTRIANITAIVSRMEANQWLTATEQKMIDQDKALYDEQESLATKLNSK